MIDALAGVDGDIALDVAGLGDLCGRKRPRGIGGSPAERKQIGRVIARTSGEQDCGGKRETADFHRSRITAGNQPAVSSNLTI